MAELVLIYGRSGSGKTTSLRNFSEDEVAVVSVIPKRLPFETKIKPFVSCDYMAIENALKTTKKKAIVIDDAVYLMHNDYWNNASKAGFQKYNDMALSFRSLMYMAKYELPDDVIVYVIGHSDRSDDGFEHFQTEGKAIDNHLCLEGECNIVLKSCGGCGVYQFQTQSNGMDTVKSPIGMFPEMLIDNDLKKIDQRIREYYGIKVEDKKEAANGKKN